MVGGRGAALSSNQENIPVIWASSNCTFFFRCTARAEARAPLPAGRCSRRRESGVSAMAAAPLSTGRKTAALRGRSALSLLDSWACTLFTGSYSCRAPAVNGFSRRSGCLLGQNDLLHRERQLAPHRQVVERDLRHPFDPPVATKV